MATDDEYTLRKIDCVMVRVPDLASAVEFYTRAFGLRPLWRDETSVGMAMAETDAEIVLHTMNLAVRELGLPAGHEQGPAGDLTRG